MHGTCRKIKSLDSLFLTTEFQTSEAGGWVAEIPSSSLDILSRFKC